MDFYDTKLGLYATGSVHGWATKIAWQRRWDSLAYTDGKLAG